MDLLRGQSVVACAASASLGGSPVGRSASLPVAMRIHWLNHAGFAVESAGGSVLVTDPWLEGTAFNDGWDLLTASPSGWSELGITHIWFSHEHPDHFSPRTLKQIPEERRSAITVLYQRTPDQRVVDFCKASGFTVVEMEPGESHRIDDGYQVTMGTVPFYDSWLLHECDGTSLLNVNDCVLQTPHAIKAVRERTGSPDILATQFSYANWVGNPEDRHLRRAEATSKLEAMRLQALHLAPRQVIPFASFVWFSHDENDYLNDEHVHVSRAVEVVESTGADAVVLYPGDVWDTSEPPPPTDENVARYESDWQELASRPRHQSPSVPVEELIGLAEKYRDRVLPSANLMVARILRTLSLLPSTTMRLWDHDTNVEFHVLDGLRTTDQPAQVELSSDSLAFMFRFDWGVDTLSVNGRFRASPAGYRRLLRTFVLGPLRNNGRRLDLSLLAETGMIKRAVDRLVLGRG